MFKRIEPKLRTLTLSTAFLFPLLLLSGCITIETEGMSTRELKEQIVESQFYKDTAAFYPDAEVGDPTLLEPLADDEQQRLQTELNQYLRAVAAIHNRRFEVLSGLFGDALVPQPESHIVLTARDLPEARTSANGEIAIDTRVVQSTLRSSLVTVFETEILLHRIHTDTRRNESGYTPAEEKIALDTYLAAREQLRLTPGRSHIGMLFSDADDRREGELGWSELRKLSRTMSNVDVRYDAQLLFLLAHEYGHLALDHFGDNPIIYSADDHEDACYRRRSMEATADVYAVILVALATPGNAADDFLGVFGGATVLDGLDTFFSYAYDYAGFSNGGAGQCSNYPSPAERFALIGEIYEDIRARQIRIVPDEGD